MRRLQHQTATATGTKYLNYDDGTQIEVPRGPQANGSRHKTDKPRFGANRQSIEDGIRSIFTKAGVEPTADEMQRALELSGGNKANDRLAQYLSSVLMARLEGKAVSKPSDWKSGSKVEIISGTREAHSGPRSPRLPRDEVELMDPETFALAAQIKNDQAMHGFSVTKDGERVDPTIVKSADRATYTLTVNGQTTDPIPYDASLEEFKEIAGKASINVETSADGSTAAVHGVLDHGDEAYAGRPTEEQWAELETAAKKRKRGATGYVRVLETAGYTLLSDDHDPRERESWVRA